MSGAYPLRRLPPSSKPPLKAACAAAPARAGCKHQCKRRYLHQFRYDAMAKVEVIRPRKVVAGFGIKTSGEYKTEDPSVALGMTLTCQRILRWPPMRMR